MEQHLDERFSLQELSAALGTSARTLQASFQQERGCTPMAQAKRLRLRRLRQLLLDHDLATSSISDLMAASGLRSHSSGLPPMVRGATEPHTAASAKARRLKRIAKSHFLV